MRSKTFCILIAVGSAIAILVALPASAKNFRVLHSFNYIDGCNPSAGVIGDSQGNLYGTTDYGAAYRSGLVFKLDRAGREIGLHNFGAFPSDGAVPDDSLVRDNRGNLYGNTILGGAFGSGIAFKLDAAGNETVLHNFAGGPIDGAPPEGLIQDNKGNLYGTTFYDGPYGYGLAFKLTANGHDTILYGFKGGAQVANPNGPLTRDDDGNLYGTSVNGGIYNAGTVFKLTPYGELSVLYSFKGLPLEAVPSGGVVRDAESNLYGTTVYGGNSSCYDGCGTVFKINPNGEEAVLYVFHGKDGQTPNSGLIRDERGKLYGTTYYSGGTGRDANAGTVFELSSTGRETVLHKFTGGNDGSNPESGLFRDAEGNLYGTTFGGGAHVCGTVFRITP